MADYWRSAPALAIVPVGGPIEAILKQIGVEDPDGMQARAAAIVPVAEAEAQAFHVRQEQQARERRAAVMREGGFPERQLAAALRGDRASTPACAHVRRYLEHDLGVDRNVLVLSGGYGAGKTTACLWGVLRLEPRHARSMRFLTGPEIEATSRYDADLRATWTKASALVIDDLGKEPADGKGQFLAKLEEIVGYFHARLRPLLITTNLTIEAFAHRYGTVAPGGNGDDGDDGDDEREGEPAGSLLSRLMDGGAVFDCGAVDLRARR